jgi:hypothetical protein
VAGTDLQELPVFNLMPDERREFHKICPASHTLLSVNCLYQMNIEKRKGMFTKLRRARGNSKNPPEAIYPNWNFAEQSDASHLHHRPKVFKPRSGAQNAAHGASRG